MSNGSTPIPFFGEEVAWGSVAVTVPIARLSNEAVIVFVATNMGSGVAVDKDSNVTVTTSAGVGFSVEVELRTITFCPG